MYVSFSRYHQSFLLFEQHHSKMVNNEYCQTLNNHGLSQDAQDRWWELLSPTKKFIPKMMLAVHQVDNKHMSTRHSQHRSGCKQDVAECCD